VVSLLAPRFIQPRDWLWRSTVMASLGPPGLSTSSRLSLPSPKKAIDLLSGDQKGGPRASIDPSVPRSGTGSGESRERSQI
jgi:hypothetical protein